MQRIRRANQRRGRELRFPPKAGVTALARSIPVVQPVPNVPLATPQSENNLNRSVTAAKQVIAVINDQAHGLKLSVEEDTGTRIFEAADRKSVEALRQIPSEEIIKGSFISIKS